MHKFKDTVTRTDGNGLKLPKFHQLLHVPRYILKFGSPKNFNSGRCESHHIHLSKVPASTAQRRQDTFENQVGNRIADHMVINRAVSCLQSKTEMPSPHSLGGTSFLLCQLSADDVHVAIPKHHNAIPLMYSQPVLDGVGALLCPLFSNYRVPCYTEHRRGVSNELIFRGHPHYRGSSWHDWAYFNWEVDEHSTAQYPGKILFFCDLRDIAPGQAFDAGIYVVIHSMHTVPTLVQHSQFIKKGSLSINPCFEICDVDTLSKPAFVVENPNQGNNYFIIPDRPSWSQILFSGDVSHNTIFN
jgi:hypothetical protein